MENLITSLLSLTSVVSPLLVFLASCYYLSKSAKADSILLFIGSGISLLITTFFTLAPYFAQSMNMILSETTKYYSIAGVIGFVGGICFSVGFLILIIDSVSSYKKNKV